jgi:hypothetical protein
MALGPTQPLTKMSTRNLPGGKGRPARKADNFSAICDCMQNVGVSTSHNPMGLHGLLQGQLYLLYREYCQIWGKGALDVKRGLHFLLRCLFEMFSQ